MRAELSASPMPVFPERVDVEFERVIEVAFVSIKERGGDANSFTCLNRWFTHRASVWNCSNSERSSSGGPSRPSDMTGTAM
jgi:hypothetical protein